MVSTDLSAMLIITDTAIVVLMPINKLKAVRATYAVAGFQRVFRKQSGLQIFQRTLFVLSKNGLIWDAGASSTKNFWY